MITKLSRSIDSFVLLPPGRKQNRSIEERLKIPLKSFYTILCILWWILISQTPKKKWQIRLTPQKKVRREMNSSSSSERKIGHFGCDRAHRRKERAGAQKEAPKAEVESSGHCEPAPTSASSTGCPWWLSCGWNSTELLPTFILVTHSIRSRSIGG